MILNPCNFTSLTRTPWASSYIKNVLKKNIQTKNVPDRIGESWEFSCDPNMESKTIFGMPLMVYCEKIRPNLRPNLLLKIISTNDNLSVQVHPPNDYAKLKSNECGKSECWLVLDTDTEDSYIYVSNEFKGPKDFEDHKIKVSKGNYFVIEPGTVHALGAGITVLECQTNLFGKSGVTYRLWDHDRLYKNGILDPTGVPRELHVENALEIVNNNETSKEYKYFPIMERCHNYSIYTYSNNFCQIQKITEVLKDIELPIKLKMSYAIVFVLSGTVNVNFVCAPQGHTIFITNDANTIIEKGSEIFIIEEI